MPPKRDLSQALANNPHSQPMVRGRGYEMSTSNIEAVEEPATKTTPPVETPLIKRDNAKIRPELITAYKLMAVQQGRKLYEVMEEALEEYLERQKVS